MRIDFQYTPQPPEPERNRAQKIDVGQRSMAETVPASAAEDQAQLSGAHTQVAALAAQAQQLPEMRQKRVDALRQAIESGRYQPDAHKVAGAMVEWMPRHRAA